MFGKGSGFGNKQFREEVAETRKKASKVVERRAGMTAAEKNDRMKRTQNKMTKKNAY